MITEEDILTSIDSLKECRIVWWKGMMLRINSDVPIWATNGAYYTDFDPTELEQMLTELDAYFKSLGISNYRLVLNESITTYSNERLLEKNGFIKHFKTFTMYLPLCTVLPTRKPNFPPIS